MIRIVNAKLKYAPLDNVSNTHIDVRINPIKPSLSL